MSQSNEQFNRTLQERHAVVKNLVKSFVKASPNNDLEKNCHAATDFLAACQHLDAILASPDKPAWLANAISIASTFVTNKHAQQASTFSTWIHENGRAMEEPIVPINGDEVPFDKMYGEIRDSLNIPEKFQEMIDALAQIISLNVIEYRTVNDALLKLKAVLASNKRGSQTAIFSAMDYGEFVRRMLKGYGKKFLGPAFDAFDKTYDEAKLRVEEADQEYRRASLAALIDAAAVKRLVASETIETSDLLGGLPAGLLDAPSDANEQRPSAEPNQQER